jgi:hypothetical protein
MSMRNASKQRTLCEVLREINDLTQDRPAVTAKLAEAESMAKRMSKKLLEYNKKIFKHWWAKNDDYEKDLVHRLNERYIVG